MPWVLVRSVQSVREKLFYPVDSREEADEEEEAEQDAAEEGKEVEWRFH